MKELSKCFGRKVSFGQNFPSHALQLLELQSSERLVFSWAKLMPCPKEFQARRSKYDQEELEELSGTQERRSQVERDLYQLRTGNGA